MNRKTIIILAAIILLGIVGFIAYLLFSVPSPEGRTIFGNLPILGGRAPVTTGVPQEEKKGITPAEEKVALRQIIDKDILAPALSADKKSIYYILRENGHILKSDLDGSNEEKLTNLTILESFEGYWSPLKTKIALFYHENGIVKKFVEETATGTPSRFLPQDAKSFSWSPDGRGMAYLLTQGDKTNLVIADQNNKNPRTVFSTPVPDFNVQWVSKNSMLFVSRPSGLAPSLVMRFDVGARRAEPILTGGRGIVSAPAPDASGFIFSRSSAKSEPLPLAFYAFKDGKMTGFNQTTIAEKCAFSPDSKKIYCGVPKGVMLSPSPDEWYKGAVSFSDSIVSTDLQTGQAATLMENEADVDVISPFVSSDGQYLFFQNKKDGTLWRLTLKE